MNNTNETKRTDGQGQQREQHGKPGEQHGKPGERQGGQARPGEREEQGRGHQEKK